MVSTSGFFYKVRFWFFVFAYTCQCANFVEPLYEPGAGGSTVGKSVKDYKVIIDSLEWKNEEGSRIYTLPVKIENSFAVKNLFGWIDDKSIIYITKDKSVCYKISGFTDPQALYINPQGTAVFFISMDHVYQFTLSTLKCQAIFSAPALGSGGSRLLGNTKFLITLYPQNSLSHLVAIDLKSRKNSLLFRSSQPITHLEAHEHALFFYSEQGLHKYFLK